MSQNNNTIDWFVINQFTVLPLEVSLTTVDSYYVSYENKFNDCKDHRNKSEVPDPVVRWLIGTKHLHK